MQHDHDVGAGIQRQRVAGLLVPTVAAVALVDMHAQTEPLCQSRSFVGAVVVHQDDGIHRWGNLVHGALQRLLRVVCGKHGHNFLVVDHRFLLRGRRGSTYDTTLTLA